MSTATSSPLSSITPTPAPQPADVLAVAAQLYDHRPSWVTFFREVLGAEGIVRQVYTTPTALGAFERTSEYRDLQQMLAKLRENDDHLPTPREPQRVITLRLPKSVHEALKAEAHDRRMSMNQLCIAKTLQVLDDKPAREAT